MLKLASDIIGVLAELSQRSASYQLLLHNPEVNKLVKQLELTSSNEVKKAAKFCLTRAFPISYENMNNDDS
jgi:phosphohistidine phosphatase SixA